MSGVVWGVWRVGSKLEGGVGIEKAIYTGAGVEVGRQFAMASGCETRVGWVKVGKPVGWEEEVDGVKQACWCGEMWDDNHEDGNHDEVWVKEAVVGSGLGKRTAVIPFMLFIMNR